MYYQQINTIGASYSVITAENCSYPVEHLHTEAEIIYVLEGELNLTINNKNYTVKKGEIALIGSMVSHEVFESEKYNKAIVIDFGPMLLGRKFALVSRLEFNQAIYNKESNDEIKAIIPLLDEIAIENNKFTTEAEMIITGNLYKITANIIRMLREEKSEEIIKETRSKAMIDKAMEMIYHHYTENITVDAVAETVGYSLSSFCRIFKETFGAGFHSVLNDVRIKNACFILKETTLPVYEISKNVGFSDTKTFCRVFKEKKGITPTQYRNRK